MLRLKNYFIIMVIISLPLTAQEIQNSYYSYGIPVVSEIRYNNSDCEQIWMYSHQNENNGTIENLNYNCGNQNYSQINFLNNSYGKLLAHIPEQNGNPERFLFIGWETNGWNNESSAKLYLSDNSWNLITTYSFHENFNGYIYLNGESYVKTFIAYDYDWENSVWGYFPQVLFKLSNHSERYSSTIYKVSITYNESTTLTNRANNLTNRVQIYPNPVKNKVYNNIGSTKTKMEVYDMNGKKLKQDFGNSINIESLTKGKYILNILEEEGDKAKSFKIVKE